MAKLNLTPSKSGYQVTWGSGVVESNVDGGFPIFTLDQLQPSHRVSLQWRTDATGYAYLQQFYEDNHALEFEIDLQIQNSGLETYNAYFQPGSFRLASVSGGTYVVAARLEVEFSDADELARALRDLREIYPTDLADVLRLLDELVNEELPE